MTLVNSFFTLASPPLFVTFHSQLSILNGVGDSTVIGGFGKYLSQLQPQVVTSLGVAALAGLSAGVVYADATGINQHRSSKVIRVISLEGKLVWIGAVTGGIQGGGA